ncbi:MAG: exo-alpha-sialidase [Sporocytophaga sp.]|uniref:exo-alpha-sialidase n=1 Tax=Sporocytophaga sp. TaxID=2231183 RepID=UPI001B04C0C2|nr:exo-alpha-sialidase [Sporocytophaga sp.]MBO9701749.1 exo-alpha-sialidase [Sporocytophaga sp.]
MLLCLGLYSYAQSFTTKEGLYDQSKTNDLGLQMAIGTETVTVFKPTATSDHYSNGVVMVGFKGYLYCQWQSSYTNEDSRDTWVAYSRSKDGKTWTAPMRLAVPTSTYYCTSGGWWVNGDTLVAYVNVWPTSLSPRGGLAYYSTSTDGLTWSSIKQVKMSDGTVMKGIIEQDPHALPNGRIICAAHFQPGLIAAPIYTDDQSGIRGWKRATYTNMTYTGDVTREIEPSWFWQRNGSAVMIFRDQTSTYHKLSAKSTDNGKTWSTAVLTDNPDSRAKQSAGNLPDGSAYMVHNPVPNKNRTPLTITLSQDGQLFDRAFVMRKGGNDLQAQQYTGTAKTLGYSYPKSTVWNGYLYAAYSTNKEDVEYTRIPLSSLGMVNQCIFGSFDECGNCTGTMTGLNPCGYESEFVAEVEVDACKYDGVFETKNAGYKGTGYINIDNAIGTSITFSINASTSGSKTISLRYANGGTADRPATIILDGYDLRYTLSFPGTGAFTTYKTINLTINLSAGAHQLELISATSDGLPNLDQIDYLSKDVRKDSCITVVTDIVESNSKPVLELYPNPSMTSFHVKLSVPKDLEIYNVDGKHIRVYKNISVLEFGNELLPGIYFAKIGNEVHKFVKY